MISDSELFCRPTLYEWLESGAMALWTVAILVVFKLVLFFVLYSPGFCLTGFLNLHLYTANVYVCLSFAVMVQLHSNINENFTDDGKPQCREQDLLRDFCVLVVYFCHTHFFFFLIFFYLWVSKAKLDLSVHFCSTLTWRFPARQSLFVIYARNYAV